MFLSSTKAHFTRTINVIEIAAAVDNNVGAVLLLQRLELDERLSIKNI